MRPGSQPRSDTRAKLDSRFAAAGRIFGEFVATMLNNTIREAMSADNPVSITPIVREGVRPSRGQRRLRGLLVAAGEQDGAENRPE
jgi:hypothetical protein